MGTMMNDNITEARTLVKNNQLTEKEVLTSFNIVGNTFLGGENAFINNNEGLTEISYDFNISRNELLSYLRRSYNEGNYHPNDRYISFDGYELVSFSSINYFKELLIQKMNGECAEFILNL